MSIMRDGDVLTRAEFLRFNKRWSDRDRAVLAEDLETFDGVSFVYGESGYNRHVRVCDADGADVITVSPGTIYYAPGLSRPGSAPIESHGAHVYRLSTHQAGGGVAKPEPALRPLCPRCNLHHAGEDCW